MEQLILLIKYAFLGLLQGITEPIPISSSGHIVIAQHLFGLHIEGLSFEVIVNTASLIAVLIIYRKDIVRLAANGTSYVVTKKKHARSDFMFIVYLIVGTIPAGVFGILFKDNIAAYFKGTIMTIGITLLITGVAL